jgi:hypothetical protein
MNYGKRTTGHGGFFGQRLESNRDRARRYQQARSAMRTTDLFSPRRRRASLAGENPLAAQHRAEREARQDGSDLPQGGGPVVMPFGKYKGRKVSDVPTEYLDWLIGQHAMHGFRNCTKEDGLRLLEAIGCELNDRDGWVRGKGD